MIKRAITSILVNDATVGGLVGLNAAGDRAKIYPIVVPQYEEAPYVAVSVIGREVVAKGCADVFSVQVVSYHTQEEGCMELHEACKTALLTAPAATYNGFELSLINFTTESDGFSVDAKLYYKIAVYNGQ